MVLQCFEESKESMLMLKDEFPLVVVEGAINRQQRARRVPSALADYAVVPWIGNHCRQHEHPIEQLPNVQDYIRQAVRLSALPHGVRGWGSDRSMPGSNIDGRVLCISEIKL